MNIFLSPPGVPPGFGPSEGIPPGFGPSVVTIGNYDGVHAGHREILRRVVAIGRERGLTPVVLTFDPHPARVLAPERAPRLIMTPGQKLRALESEGIGAVLVLPFSHELARLTPEEFVASVLVRTLGARCVLVGEDFRFGHKQAGNIETLRQLGYTAGFTVEPVAPVCRRGERISSSAVRKLIAEGAVSRACRMLDAPFALEGNVVRGHGIGSKQTVPTLNLAARNEVLPKNGVYVTRTTDVAGKRTWPSITNVGNRPTFDGDSLTIETFLLGPFDGQTPDAIEVAFLRYVRDERKFETPAELKAQIGRDVQVALRLHRRLNKAS